MPDTPNPLPFPRPDPPPSPGGPSPGGSPHEDSSLYFLAPGGSPVRATDRKGAVGAKWFAYDGDGSKGLGWRMIEELEIGATDGTTSKGGTSGNAPGNASPRRAKPGAHSKRKE